MAAGPSLRIAPVQYQLGVGSGGYSYGLVIPATILPGDCLILAIDDTAYPPPSDWTQLATVSGGQVWWKVATSSDPGVTLTDPGGGYAGGFLLVYKDAATTTPLISHTSGGPTTSYTAPAITTTVNLSTVVEVWLTVGGPFTLSVPATAEASVEVNPPGLGNYAYGVSDQTQAVAGLAAAKTATTSPACITWAGFSLVIFPAGVPDAPVLSLPTNGTQESLSGTPTFSWIPQPTTGDGAMNAYAFRRKTTGAYSYWNTTSQTWVGSIVWNTSSANSVTFPAAAWSDSSDYSWSVATQESTYSGQSAFATDYTVNGQVAPTVTVTAPTLTVFIPDPTVTWTDTVAAGTVETGYRVIVYTAAQYGAGGFVPGVGPSAWDSGNIQPYSTTVTLPANALVNGTYRAYVQITETGNVASLWEYSGFTVEIELPATPTLTATAGTDPVTDAPLVALALQGHDNLLSAQDAAFEHPTWHPGPITAVGSGWSASGSALTSLAVHPTAVGDVLVLAGTGFDTAGVIPVSGGGVTTWQYIFSDGDGFSAQSALFFGVVTAAGAATITLTGGYTAKVLFAAQFTVGVPAIWTLDCPGDFTSLATGPLASGTYQPITPASDKELLVGVGDFEGGSPGGSATGFTYTNLVKGQFVYNPNATNPNVQAPPWTQTSGRFAAISGLLVPSNPAGVGSYGPTNATLAQTQAQADEGSFSMAMQAVGPGAMSAKTAPYTI